MVFPSCSVEPVAVAVATVVAVAVAVAVAVGFVNITSPRVEEATRWIKIQ